jgi:Zn-dependent protease with chaperone function
MIKIEAKYYSGLRSQQVPVILKAFDDGSVQVESVESGEILLRQNTFSARVSDRLADTPRFLTFPDGTVLETDDNSAVDNYLKKNKRGSWTRWIHLLESRKRYVFAAGILLVLIGVGMVKYGVPAAARVITSHLPISLFNSADRQVLDLLDRMVFKTSELSESTENRVRSHFSDTLASKAPLRIQLLFRKGGILGPNAFALPGGTIVFTDELVHLAEHDDELLGILAHEIGHVFHQHAMRRMVQSSMISFAFLAITGDASGISEIFLGLPVVLTELAYSRRFERDADAYAMDYLKARNISPSRFADILERIDQRYKAQENEEKEQKWSGYLSTHPPTSERIKAFRP